MKKKEKFELKNALMKKNTIDLDTMPDFVSKCCQCNEQGVRMQVTYTTNILGYKVVIGVTFICLNCNNRNERIIVQDKKKEI